MRTFLKKISPFLLKENRLIVFTLGFLLLFSLGSYAFASALYHPGDTNDPTCGPTDPGCYVDLLPDQSSHAGAYLTTNGTTDSWATIPTATSTVTGLLSSADWTAFSGKQAALGFTPLNAASNLSDVAVANTALNNILPSQTSNAGKFLTTDGTNTSWAATLAGTIAPTQVAFGTASSTITSSGELTFNGTTNEFLVGVPHDGSPTPYTTFKVDPANGSYQLGDANTIAGATYLNIADSSKVVSFFGASAPSAISSSIFSGSGVNDINIVGTYLGGLTTTFTATIDGTNRQTLTYGTLSGTFLVGETVTAVPSSASGIVVSDTGTVIVLHVASGNFAVGDTLTGGTSGATSHVTVASPKGDTLSFTDTSGTNNFHNDQILSTMSFSKGMGLNAATVTGHTLGDSWSVTITETPHKGLNLDFANQQYVLGDPTGMAYVNVSGGGGSVSIHGTGGTCSFDGSAMGGTCFSDARLKTNVVDLGDALATLDKLRPVTYNWIDPTMPQGTNIGLIAQEVQQIYPDFVGAVGNTGYLGVKYDAFIVPTIKAVQELDLKVEPLLSIDPTVSGSLASLVGQYLENAVVAIKDLTVNTLHINGSVCADDVCVTKAQFKQMLLNAGGASSTPPPAPDPTPDPSTATSTPTSDDTTGDTSTSTPVTVSDPSSDDSGTATTTPADPSAGSGQAPMDDSGASTASSTPTS